jgi:hypothetical protein
MQPTTASFFDEYTVVTPEAYHVSMHIQALALTAMDF